MLLNDDSITRLANCAGMIEPFVDSQVSDGVISYGLSSFGYDIRCADEFVFFDCLPSDIPGDSVIDPKRFDPLLANRVKTNIFVLPGNSFVLGRSVEKIKMPRNVTAIVLGKSTYARCGLVVNATPLEAEWSGYITLEFSNTTHLPIYIYANEGIAQLLFFTGLYPTVSYADRKGKYQDQVGVVLPIVKGS